MIYTHKTMLFLGVLLLACQGSVGYVVPIQGRPTGHSDYVLHAEAATTTLQQWYNRSSGLWDTTGWWNSANCITMLADLTAVDRSMTAMTLDVFQNTFVEAQEYNLQSVKIMDVDWIRTYTWPDHPPGHGEPLIINPKGFLNNYYDDEGWWALGWIKVYDLTHDPQYIKAAVDIFADMTTGYDATCGGLWWDKSHTQNGAIENELFLSVAAHLANRMPNKQYYLDWALKEWKWFQASGMINQQNNINNGLNLVTCQNDNGTVWSYNQGVILGGLVELNRASPDDSYLLTANKIAFAALKTLTDSNGILHDACEPNCGADGPQFKGVFMRNIQILQQVSPNDQLKTFIDANANSIWTNDRGADNQLGTIWSGPFTGATASTQSSACDALVAAVAVG